MKRSKDVKISENDKIFSQKLTIYGQFLAIYLVILIIFVVLRAITNEGNINLLIYDPLVLVMLLITFITSITLIVLTIKKRQIVFGENYFVLRNRFFAKKILYDDIKKIKIGGSPTKIVNDRASFIRFKIKERKKIYLIRTASFDKAEELLNLFVELKQKIGNK